jgi:hypothetical protein
MNMNRKVLMLDTLKAKGFDVLCLSHAAAILTTDFPGALVELEEALAGFSVPIAEIIGSGGGEAEGTQRLRKALSDKGWAKTKFVIEKSINGEKRESISHEVDHVRALDVDGKSRMIALEIEWNNKDPFFDRDLENFKRLHAEGAISIGVVVTRGSTLQAKMPEMVLRFAKEKKVESFDTLKSFGVKAPTERQQAAVEKRAEQGRAAGKSFAECWAEHFVSDKFGAATTHWRKLQDRVDRGVGNPCPLLLIGLPEGIVTF